MSELRITCSTSSENGADVADENRSVSVGAVVAVTESGSASSSRASARPAASAGSSVRGPSGRAGSTRPPSSISGWIGVTKPAATSEGSQPGERVAPVKRVVSISTRSIGPGIASRTSAASSVSRVGAG